MKLGEFTWQLITFYALASTVFWALYWKKLKDGKVALLFSAMTVFVAREYWELPIFVAGYLGIMNMYFPMVFHHLLVFLVFLVLISYSKIKFTMGTITLLLVTPLIISPLLLTQMRNVYTLYLARTIGVAVFGAMFIHGGDAKRIGKS